MTKPAKYLNLLFLFIIIGCDKNPDYNELESAGASIEMAVFAEEAVADDAIADDVKERKLIKEGTLEFETKDIKETRETVLRAVKKYKAYISSDREFNSSGRVSNTIEIRVSSDKFDALLTDATLGVENFDSKEITVKDVTEEFLDVEARLKTKKELEIRYLDLLKQAKSVVEILEIEKQIGTLRADIESIEGRLNYLKDRVSYSTLYITFYETLPEKSAFGEKFKDGFKNGWINLVWFFVFLVNLWPFLLILIAFFIGRRIYKKKK